MLLLLTAVDVIVPDITDVNPDVFSDAETGIEIVGTGFLASQGAGKVYLADSAHFATANKVEQTVSGPGWADTLIGFTAEKGALLEQAVHYMQADYLATGDGVTDDHDAIQDAFDDLAASGERLIFEAGTYFIDEQVTVPSGLDIVFDPAAKIVIGAGNHGLIFDGLDGSAMPATSDHAAGYQILKNVTLRHEGTTQSGNCIRVPDNAAGPHHFILKDITFERADSWHFRCVEAHHFVIDGYTVLNGIEPTANGNIDDGLDLVGCHDAEIMNFDINCYDDGITVKSYGTDDLALDSYNLYIHDGTVTSIESMGIGFGSEIRGDIHDVVWENIDLVNCYVPLYLKGYNTTALGDVYDCEFTDIEITDNVGRVDYPVHCDNVVERLDMYYDITFTRVNFTGPICERGMRLLRCKEFIFIDCDFALTTIGSPERATNNRALAVIDTCHDHTFSGMTISGARTYILDVRDSTALDFSTAASVTADDTDACDFYVRISGATTLGNDFSGLVNPDSIPPTTTANGGTTAGNTWGAGFP